MKWRVSDLLSDLRAQQDAAALDARARRRALRATVVRIVKLGRRHDPTALRRLEARTAPHLLRTSADAAAWFLRVVPTRSVGVALRRARRLRAGFVAAQRAWRAYAARRRAAREEALAAWTAAEEGVRLAVCRGGGGGGGGGGAGLRSANLFNDHWRVPHAEKVAIVAELHRRERRLYQRRYAAWEEAVAAEAAGGPPGGGSHQLSIELMAARRLLFADATAAVAASAASGGGGGGGVRAAATAALRAADATTLPPPPAPSSRPPSVEELRAVVVARRKAAFGERVAEGVRRAGYKEPPPDRDGTLLLARLHVLARHAARLAAAEEGGGGGADAHNGHTSPPRMPRRASFFPGDSWQAADVRATTRSLEACLRTRSGGRGSGGGAGPGPGFAAATASSAARSPRATRRDKSIVVTAAADAAPDAEDGWGDASCCLLGHRPRAGSAPSGTLVRTVGAATTGVPRRRVGTTPLLLLPPPPPATASPSSRREAAVVPGVAEDGVGVGRVRGGRRRVQRKSGAPVSGGRGSSTAAAASVEDTPLVRQYKEVTRAKVTAHIAPYRETETCRLRERFFEVMAARKAW